jgi:ribosomal protein S27AE
MTAKSPQQDMATALNRKVLSELGVSEPVSALCPECGTECLADPETPFFTCGFCGYGPFTSERE